MALTASDWLQRIRRLYLPQKVRIMNVCGGHERSITQAGLRAALPPAIELIPGPGCPVCVCPEEDVHLAIRLAMEEELTLATFGDMLRVPVNVRKSDVRSLEQARAAGADVVAVASPQEVVGIARQAPDRPVVFLAAGFETTIAPVAAMMAQGVPQNLSLLLSGRLTWPAVSMLLNSGEVGFDALIAPGHVATVMGPEEWDFVSADHGIPTAVAGFDSESLLAAIYAVLRQLRDGGACLDNCYPGVVQPGGNPMARRVLEDVMDITDAAWRGIGTLPASGFALRAEYAAHDARKVFPVVRDDTRRRAGEMPAGCDCARVVLGQIRPDQCRIFGGPCTPRTPVGPCMVSDEGACRIWWAGGRRSRAKQAIA
ncbi:hydrogenase expression/formation protein HypD [Aliiruegeria haliotis]|uniref:Hydrogenase maturation factor n=1 Tax=Aliiruegeria haliotis TaxID=1280846 RepID=A0A2T0RYZ8_9RHOB|nr:hydrogenase formation protein HypD [Aliiruegeria haliotis]PRY26409.1 hydrogenase expression/formation protein HypD [Aliiruegeria haliotis]